MGGLRHHGSAVDETPAKQLAKIAVSIVQPPPQGTCRWGIGFWHSLMAVLPDYRGAGIQNHVNRNNSSRNLPALSRCLFARGNHRCAPEPLILPAMSPSKIVKLFTKFRDQREQTISAER